MNNNQNVNDFLEIFREFGGQIYGYVFLRTGRNKEIAEDLAQDVFVKAWQHRQRFDPAKANIRTWLFTIARNSVIDYWRKSKSINIDEAEFDKVQNEKDELESVALLNYVHQELCKLDQTAQDLITLRYIQDLEIQEISIIIGKNYNATKVAIHRALENLKKLINEQE